MSFGRMTDDGSLTGARVGGVARRGALRRLTGLAAAVVLASVLRHPSPLGAQSAPLPPVVNAEWLATELARPDLVVLHVGSDSSYQAAHVPGALRLDFAGTIIAPASPGALRMELPDAAALEAALRALGVREDSRIVLVFDATPRLLQAARTFFTLEWAGLRGRVALLDGGLPAWRESAARSVARGPGRRTRAGDVRIVPDPSRMVTRENVQSAIADGSRQLVDARTAEFFAPPELGGGPNGGHIESAVSLPYTSVTDPAGRLKARGEIERLLLATGVIPDERTVAYCHIGLQGSLVYLALRHIGRDVALYDGSYEDWSRR